MTTRILLPHEDVTFPNDGATIRPAFVDEAVASTGAAPAGTPAVTVNPLVFLRDTANDHAGLWTFRLPSDYTGTPLIVVKWASTVNTGNVLMAAGLAPIADASTQWTAATFNACDLWNGGSGLAVPGTIAQTKETSWALTATSVTAGGLIQVFLSRRSTQAGDTSTGDVNVLAVEFEYAS